MTAGKRKHRRKREDPLVPIDGARVRAAIAWKGLSVNAAAGCMGVSQRTLDSIVRRKTKRCYESLRHNLARLVGRPATWLGGETDLQPALTPWLPLPELGYQPPLWVDENMRIIRPPAGGDLTQRTSLPPRYQLAAHDLSSAIINAWKRDVEDRNDSEAKSAISRLAIGRWSNNPWDRVAMLVTRLISAFWWRRAFLKAGLRPGLRPGLIPGAVDSAEDDFAVAAASALTTLLKPWLSGREELDYEWFVDLLEWASAGFGKNPSTGGT